MSLLCIPRGLHCVQASSCQKLVPGEALLDLLHAPLVCASCCQLSCTAALLLASVFQCPAASSLALQLCYLHLSFSLTADWTPCSPEAGHS